MQSPVQQVSAPELLGHDSSMLQPMDRVPRCLQTDGMACQSISFHYYYSLFPPLAPSIHPRLQELTFGATELRNLVRQEDIFRDSHFHLLISKAVLRGIQACCT